MPSKEATRLARKLAALPEHTMRAHVLHEYLNRAPLVEATRVLAEIQRHGRMGGPPFDVALVALATVLTQDMLHYELLARLYNEAKDAGLDTLRQLFFSSKDEPLAKMRDDLQRDYTLGHRKWLARDTRREVLAKLMHRPEPAVMPNLLRNPRVTERDVVLLAAKRPVDPEVLRLIFNSPRWIARYAVKRALVLNPYTPTDLAIRLLSLLTRQDQRLVRSLSTLPAAVPPAAALLLLPPAEAPPEGDSDDKTPGS